jgi:predicted RNA-binding Zn ribbon-like protein
VYAEASLAAFRAAARRGFVLELDTRVTLDGAVVVIHDDTLDRTTDRSGLIRSHTLAELRSVQDLRPRLRRIWEADEDEVVSIVNTLLRESRALPQLVRHDGWPYHLHATPSDAPLARRMAVEAAMAFVDVVREQQLSRLRICEFPGCDNVVMDLSKNRSKRFCESGCGNRAAVTAYRARKAAARR